MEVQLSSSRPYLLRAIYEWILDNDLTPYLLVDATHEDAHVPTQYIEDGKIVLNIAPRAITNLEISNDYVGFDARFTGKAMQVSFPTMSVLAIYARENGKGMVFNENEDQFPEPPTTPGTDPTKPKLKLVT